MTQIYMQYGPMALMLLMGAIGWVAVRFGLNKIESQRVRDTLMRLGAEMRAVVTEVNDAMVDELKRANEDGKLTAEEKRKAQRMAVDILKTNLGMKGVKRVTKVLGIESLDSWLMTHVTDTVESLKPKAAAPKK